MWGSVRAVIADYNTEGWDALVRTSFHPVCNKDIGIPGSTIVSIAAKDNFFSVGRKHGECIKTFVPAYFLKIGSITIYRIEVEWETPFIFMIGCKYDPFAIGHKCRSPVSLSKPGDLSGIFPIRI